MKTLRYVIAAAVLGLQSASASTAAPAQPVQMAQAAHKGTFNFLRTAPNRHAHILLKMHQGTRFQIVGASGEYYAVVLADGMHGWTFKTNARPL